MIYPTCGLSRWKSDMDEMINEGVPTKVLWYFPPMPRFQLMNRTKDVSKDLTWHDDKRICDGYLRYHGDSPA